MCNSCEVGLVDAEAVMWSKYADFEAGAIPYLTAALTSWLRGVLHVTQVPFVGCPWRAGRTSCREEK